MKKLTIIILAITIITLFAGVAAAWPARLTIKNWTGDPVYIKLGTSYYLTAKPGVSVYTIARALFYPAKATACGITAGAVLNGTVNNKITFTECPRMLNPFDKYGNVRPQFRGEPSMEKVSWILTPGIWWHFLY